MQVTNNASQGDENSNTDADNANTGAGKVEAQIIVELLHIDLSAQILAEATVVLAAGRNAGDIVRAEAIRSSF